MMFINDIIQYLENVIKVAPSPAMSVTVAAMKDMLHDLETSEGLQVETLTDIFTLQHPSLKKDYTP